jgi:MFS transporter, PAT family, beta-lactamase induction signal transducer AmpG
VNKIGINRSLWVSIGLLSVGILPYWLLAQAAQSTPAGQSPSETLLILAINSEYFFAGMEATAFIAFLTSLCNSQFSATQYALFTSLMLSGKSFIVAPMGSLAERVGWSNFFLLSILAAIPGLLLLVFLAPWNSKVQKN